MNQTTGKLSSLTYKKPKSYRILGALIRKSVGQNITYLNRDKDRLGSGYVLNNTQ